MLQQPWWEHKRNELLHIAKEHTPCYVYHLPTQQQQVQALIGLQSIHHLYYAVKANPHPAILANFLAQNIGFECVSIQELQHLISLFPSLDKKRLLFTPNFAAQKEYEWALANDCYLSIDSLYPLKYWSTLFKDRCILLRIDPGFGIGHHKYVRTGGDESKFGIPPQDLAEVVHLMDKYNITIIGLHAHCGSGILSPTLWQRSAKILTDLSSYFTTISIINLGGGLGIVEKPGQQPLNLDLLDTSLLSVQKHYPQLKFWLEPGRFLVAESGVILAKVTQYKTKGKQNFIGLETGMNSFIRPALYGAYHPIVNLTRLYTKHSKLSHIVGPICESGDILGHDRLLPPDTAEGDVILIANTGAYGHCMSSNYNLRPPAAEIILK